MGDTTSFHFWKGKLLQTLTLQNLNFCNNNAYLWRTIDRFYLPEQ